MDPSGRDIPPANSRIADKITSESKLSSLASLELSQSGKIVLILTAASDRDILEESGVMIGDNVTRKNDGFWCGENFLQIESTLAEKIILRCEQ